MVYTDVNRSNLKSIQFHYLDLAIRNVCKSRARADRAELVRSPKHIKSWAYLEFPEVEWISSPVNLGKQILIEHFAQ